MMPIEDLRGTRIFITGASSGIGAAAAQALASCGASVCLHYNRSEAAAAEIVERVNAAGGSAFMVGGDVTNPDIAEGLVEQATDKLGGLDCLVNNAGAIERTPLSKFDEDVFHRVFQLNTVSVLRFVRAAYPYLAKSDRPSIINLGSIAGRNGGAAGSGVYSAAKAAIHSLTRSLAKEFAADGIRVNAIAPGVIATPFHDETPPEILDALLSSIPMGRLGTAEDCAWAFAFLASPKMSGYITGQIIDINGGQLMP